METPVLKVGALAARTGLSVRTLHHYDEIGLLRPSRRTAAGHRLYAMDEVERLHMIASLRQLGLSLEEIRVSLDGSSYSLEKVLTLQVERLRGEIARQGRLVERLEALRDRVVRGGELTLDDVTASIQATVDYEKYYSKEQLEQLARRADAMGRDELEKAAQAWQEVFAGMARLHDAGVPVDDPRAQAYAEQARALIHAFTGGDPAIAASLRRMYADGGGGAALTSHGMGVGAHVMAYYRDVMEVSKA